MKTKTYKYLTIWGALACTILLYGCASMSKVGEARVDMASLAGKWEGKYTSAATGRSGEVFLDLTSTKDNAKGGIIMHPTSPEHTSSAKHGKMSYGHDQRAKAVPLAIDFVQAEGGTIKGEVAPYQDPRFNNSTMHTSFQGTVQGDTMKGTFTVKVGDTGDSYTGNWWAKRN